jgi:hypothetical protein
MIDRTVLRLIISIAVPISSALVMEQLPKARVAEVPFAFQVEEQTLPPGTYSVKEGGLGRGIRIQNEKSGGAAMKCMAAKSAFGRTQPARLVFDSYDGRYLLAEIWFEADGRGVILRQKTSEQRRPATHGEVTSVWLQ